MVPESDADDKGDWFHAAIREEPWSFDNRPGRNIVTEHYVIHTTIADRELLLLWIVAPPGLEAFFREVATRPGTQLLREPRSN